MSQQLQPQIVGYHDHEQTRGFVRCQHLWRDTLQCVTVASTLPIARRKLATKTNVRLAFVFETTTKKPFKVADAIAAGLEKMRANKLSSLAAPRQRGRPRETQS